MAAMPSPSKDLVICLKLECEVCRHLAASRDKANVIFF